MGPVMWVRAPVPESSAWSCNLFLVEAPIAGMDGLFSI